MKKIFASIFCSILITSFAQAANLKTIEAQFNVLQARCNSASKQVEAIRTRIVNTDKASVGLINQLNAAVQTQTLKCDIVKNQRTRIDELRESYGRVTMLIQFERRFGNRLPETLADILLMFEHGTFGTDASDRVDLSGIEEIITWDETYVVAWSDAIENYLLTGYYAVQPKIGRAVYDHTSMKDLFTSVAQVRIPSTLPSATFMPTRGDGTYDIVTGRAVNPNPRGYSARYVPRTISPGKK